MSTATCPAIDDCAAPVGDARQHLIERSLAFLRQWLAAPFGLADAETGEPLAGAPQELLDWPGRAEICREVARRGKPEFIAEDGPLAALAIPLADDEMRCVAIGVFKIADAPADTPCASWLLRDAAETSARLAAQTPQSSASLVRLAKAVGAMWHSEQRAERSRREVENISLYLSAAYEELNLLYRLTRELKLSSSDDHLVRLAVEWLADVIPAEAFAVYLPPRADADAGDEEGQDQPALFHFGECPIACEEFPRMLASLGLDRQSRPAIVNRAQTACDDWPFPQVREAVLSPLCEGDKVLGWLAAFNHNEGREFGSVEAGLLGSVGAILGIHCGNIDLYRKQREFLAGVVRALSSAIDAKDPYTCGHSDRVARVSVRLAQQLGCTPEQVNTVYLSGLLHDVGKIGIDDTVLRKPGRLTGPEFEHIKTHTEIGYRILRDIKQFDEVLPVVLHHHEQWDGHGYPRALAGEKIPFYARIVAVADAFDAMGSDRPYRHGMPEEKLDAILREGSGSQWDPTVIDAFFAARDDIRQISTKEREVLKLDVQQWL